jgi:hypothetical protein
VLNFNLNRLSGSLPSQIGEITSMTKLDLSYNRMLGSLPTKIGNLTNMPTLLLGGNFSTGKVPPELCSLCWNMELNIFMGDYCNAAKGLSCSTDPTCHLFHQRIIIRTQLDVHICHTFFLVPYTVSSKPTIKVCTTAFSILISESASQKCSMQPPSDESFAYY